MKTYSCGQDAFHSPQDKATSTIAMKQRDIFAQVFNQTMWPSPVHTAAIRTTARTVRFLIAKGWKLIIGIISIRTITRLNV